MTKRKSEKRKYQLSAVILLALVVPFAACASCPISFAPFEEVTEEHSFWTEEKSSNLAIEDWASENLERVTADFDADTEICQMFRGSDDRPVCIGTCRVEECDYKESIWIHEIDSNEYEVILRCVCRHPIRQKRGTLESWLAQGLVLGKWLTPTDRCC